MDVAEKANGLTTSAFYSLGRNDLLSNILYSGCSAGELLIFLTSLARTSIPLPAPPTRGRIGVFHFVNSAPAAQRFGAFVCVLANVTFFGRSR